MFSLFRPKPYDANTLRNLESMIGTSFGVSVDLLARCRLRHVTISDDYVSLETCWGGNTFRYLSLWRLHYYFNHAGLFFPADGSPPLVCMCPESCDPLIFITADIESFCTHPQKYLRHREIEKNYDRFDTVRPPWLAAEETEAGLITVLSPYCLAPYDFYHVEADRPSVFARIRKGLASEQTEAARLVAGHIVCADDLFQAKRLWELSESLLRAGFHTEALQVADNALYCGCHEATRQIADGYMFETHYDEIESWYKRLSDIAVDPPAPALIEARIVYCRGLKSLSDKNNLRNLVR